VVRRVLAFPLICGAALLVALGLGTPAQAADVPTALRIEGGSLSEPVSLRDAGQHDLFNRLLHQVSWMAGGNGDPMKPDQATLGPKYLLTVYAGDKAVQRYDVYPQAGGGPRVHRPVDQPQGRVGEAWFYVSISVPELMRAAGVPIGDTHAGGATLDYNDPAGYIPAAVHSSDRPAFSLDQLVSAQRRTVLAWVGTAVALLLLLLAAARRSRRYSG
jgi:hypothetical protein